ncbi:hypothetical protein [Nocardia sp. CA-135398]|uniref:hypothetical protein n=1 Tax=Nocardia sp. CA-135398 TaxID=3239977 RepID=UPI003D969496
MSSIARPSARSCRRGNDQNRQNFTTLLDTIAQRHSAGDSTGSAASATDIPAPDVRVANIPQEVKDALQPTKTGMLDQLNHTADEAAADAQRFRAGDISAGEFDDLINQLVDRAVTQYEQLQDSTKEKPKTSATSTPTGSR